MQDGERVMWVVEGGVWKASFVEEEEGDNEDDGLLWISEVVVPGWTEKQHEFLKADKLRELMGGETAERWSMLVRKEQEVKWE